MKDHNSLFRKLNNTYGFSLTETLTTMIIMSFVGIMVTTGIMSSTRAFKQITEYTNAQMMLSNTITALQDELIYALPDTLSGASSENSREITFEHVIKGTETIKFQDADDVDKGIYVSYGESSAAINPIVSYQGSTSLYNNWTVSDEGEGIISISVYIYKPDRTEPLVSVENYEIELLNG